MNAWCENNGATTLHMSTAERMTPTPPDSPEDHGRLRPSGGFRKLRAFQTTTVIHFGTVAFCTWSTERM